MIKDSESYRVEHSAPQNPEHMINDSEKYEDDLESLIQELGFIETAELMDAKDMLIAGLSDPNADPSSIEQAWIAYENLAQGIIESSGSDPAKYSKAHIAKGLYKAIIFREVGDITRYAETLDITETHAANEHLDTISTRLVKEINEIVELLPHTAEKLVILLRGRLSDENRLFLGDMIREKSDLEDVIDAAYGMIIDEGDDDPDELLAEIGFLEPNPEA